MKKAIYRIRAELAFFGYDTSKITDQEINHLLSKSRINPEAKEVKDAQILFNEKIGEGNKSRL